METLAERLRALRRRLALWLRPGTVERGLDDEMRFHIECETAERIRAGMAPEAAHRSALVDFGGVERFKEETREALPGHLLAEAAQDVRYAGRLLRRYPAFATGGVITLALGIGATTAIYSLVQGVLLQPLPYREPERLVAVYEHHLARDARRNVVSVPAFEEWRRSARSFSSLAALVPAPATITGGGASERVAGAQVSPAYFAQLGATAALGRALDARDEAVGGALVAVLSDGFWRRRFGADPGVIGRQLTLDDRQHTIVGVMPPSFEPVRLGWMGHQDIWLPFVPDADNRAWGRALLVVGRLAPGVSVTTAGSEMTAIAARMAATTAEQNGWSATVVGLREEITGAVKTPLLVLLFAAALLLLLAVLNVTNLMLGQMGRRRDEFALRRTLGASRWRLLRQVLAQCATLGAVGGALGVGIAFTLTRLLVRLLPADVPRADAVAVDGMVLWFALAITAAAILMLAAAGSSRVLRAGIAETLKGASSRRAGSGTGGGTLVVAEVALALVLSLLAGLTVRSFAVLQAVPLGFDPEHVMAARVALPGDAYVSPEARAAFFAALRERLLDGEGMTAVGTINRRPLSAGGPATDIADAAHARTNESPAPTADVRFADAAAFQSLRIPLHTGSLFDTTDRAGAPLRVVISRTAAQSLWGDQPAVGKRVAIALWDGVIGEVIGVVGDVHWHGPRVPTRPTVYLPADLGNDAMDIVVRSSEPPASILGAMRSAVAELDPRLALYQATPLDADVRSALARDRLTTALFAGFALLSVVLAAVGIYSVLAAEVASQRRELGIRAALGARATRVVLMVLRRGLVRVLAGIAIGLLAALGLARVASALLFGVGAADPASYLSVTGLLLAVALAATLLPAVLAARISPMTVIRSE